MSQRAVPYIFAGVTGPHSRKASFLIAFDMKTHRHSIRHLHFQATFGAEGSVTDVSLKGRSLPIFTEYIPIYCTRPTENAAGQQSPDALPDSQPTNSNDGVNPTVTGPGRT